MARSKQLKRTKPSTRTAPQPETPVLPVAPHVRTPEWNGLKVGDAVRVLRPGRRAQWKYSYTFLAHVAVQRGDELTEYIDVLERPRRDTHGGKWRSFTPEQVVKA